MNILKNISLKSYNTFGMDVFAEYFIALNDIAQLQEIITNKKLPKQKLILGGGSNILLTKNIEGTVIKNNLKGIEIAEENKDYVWLQVQAGEVWHDFVLYAINKGLGGIENLSLIPGCVGASPMQNIGAYGVEVKETIDEVVAWHLEENEFIVFKNDDCHFGYRDSIFKHQLNNKTLITSVTFKLSKKPQLNISYGAIQQQLEARGVTEPSVKSVSDAVIAIRRSKLPDPMEIGNAGSFFKNPTINREQFHLIKENYPNISAYPVNDNEVKLAAGWLIEQCGWKGYRNEDSGVHEKQALVLVNYGNAKGKEIYKLSEEILQSVNEKFGVVLEREVSVW